MLQIECRAIQRADDATYHGKGRHLMSKQIRFFGGTTQGQVLMDDGQQRVLPGIGISGSIRISMAGGWLE